MGKRRSTSNSVSFFAFQDIITSVVGIFVLITLIMAIELAQTVADASEASSEGVSVDLLKSLVSLEAGIAEMQAEFDALSSAQNSASGLNRFNRQQMLADAQTRLQQIQQRTARIEQDLEDTKQSLVEAKKIEEQLLAQNRSAEAEREEMKRLQDKRKEIERYSAVLEIDKPLIFRDQTQEGRAVVLVKLDKDEILVADSASGTTQKFSGSSRAAKFSAWLAKTQLSSRQILVIVKPKGVEDFEEVKNSLDGARANWGFDVAEQGANFQLRYEMEMAP